MKAYNWKNHTIGTLCLLLITLCNNCWSQLSNFQPITTNDGLSQNSVTSIVQDSFGFIWIATQDGLNKYDGTNFTKYDANFNDITQENFSRIGKIYLDSFNRLWRITSDGVISYYDDPSDSFILIDTIINASVILEKEVNQFWIGSYTEGLHLLTLNGNDHSMLSLISDIGIYNIINHQSDMLIASDRGLLSYNIKDNNVRSLYSDLAKYHISDIIAPTKGQLLISTFNNGLYTTNTTGGIESVNSIPSNLRIQDLHLSTDNVLWIATYNDGVYTIRDDAVSHYSHDPPLDNSINYNDIICVYEDHQKNIWIGTDGGGLSLLKSNQKPIHRVSNQDIPIEMAVDVTRSISTDSKGDIWIGTSGKGLTTINSKKKKPEHYSVSSQYPYDIPNERIMSLFHDDKDRLWIGTQEGGLLSYNNKTKNIKSVNSDIPAKTIWDITSKDENHIWLCTRQSGLILYNSVLNIWKQYIPNQEYSLRVIIKDNEQYYIGTDQGDLLLFNEQDASFTKIDIDINTGDIKSLHLDDKHLWIGTQRVGIVVLNVINNTTRIINEDHGLPNKVIYALLNQNNQYLWTSTNKGICQIDKTAFYNKEEDIINQCLNHKNGLIGNEFNTGAYHKDENGIMYFGAIEGVNWFNPNEIRKDNTPIDIAFLELVTSTGLKKEITPLHNKSKLRLSYEKRHFQIRYTDLEFGLEESINFRYRLKGYNTEWVDNETNRLISFSNVPPGQYLLELNASLDKRTWNNKSQEIAIEIIPAFWQTWYFKILVIGLIGFLTWKLINTRIKTIKQASLLQQELAQSEATALKSQMNPHFLFNSLNAIDNFILNNDPEKASDYLTKFSKLIRRILDYSDQARISLSQEIEILCLYVQMEQMRFPEKFEFNLKLDATINTENIKVPPLLIQPYVENAIWHGLMHLEQPGRLEIEFAQEKDFLICTVIDNGIGRIKAQNIKSKSATKRKSRGMKITNDRIRLLYELAAESGKVEIIDLYSEGGGPSGTKIMIRLPI